jgi:hypothetical protein
MGSGSAEVCYGCFHLPEATDNVIDRGCNSVEDCLKFFWAENIPMQPRDLFIKNLRN